MHSSAGFSSNPGKIPTKDRENTVRIMSGPGGLGGMASSTQNSQNIHSGQHPHQHSGGAGAANQQDFSLK